MSFLLFQGHLYVSWVSFCKVFNIFLPLFFFGFGVSLCFINICKYFSFHISVLFPWLFYGGREREREGGQLKNMYFLLLNQDFELYLDFFHLVYKGTHLCFFSSNCTELCCIFRSMIHLEFILYSFSFHTSNCIFESVVISRTIPPICC